MTGMTTYFCVLSEFYKNGTVKAAMFSRLHKAKPKDTKRNTPIGDFYKEWFDTEQEAAKRLDSVLKGTEA